MSLNVNEHYNILTFFRSQPLGEAKLLLALVQGELDERSLAPVATTPAKRSGRPKGSRNKTSKAAAGSTATAESTGAVTEVN